MKTPISKLTAWKRYYHGELAKKLLQKPENEIHYAHEELQKLYFTLGARPVLLKWDNLLKQSVEVIVKKLEEASEEMDWLRQFSPFCASGLELQTWKKRWLSGK